MAFHITDVYSSSLVKYEYEIIEISHFVSLYLCACFNIER